MKLFICVAILAISIPLVAMQRNSDASYRLTGRIINQDGAVIPGLSLDIKKNGESFGGFTDINGLFDIGLSQGDYTITSSEIPESKFRAFIKIVDKGPNPQDIEFIIDSSTLCKREFKGAVYPAVIKSAVPKTPPAARAVRALGLVTVMASAGPDGKVVSVKSVSGHPLLKAACEMAARKFEFEPSSNSDERLVPLLFDFIDSGLPARVMNRFECLYRIVVVEEPSRIETSVSG